MSTTRVTAKIEVEFETKSEVQARPALIRIPGYLTTAIALGSMGSTAMTGVVEGSVRVVVIDQTIDGKPVS